MSGRAQGVPAASAHAARESHTPQGRADIALVTERRYVAAAAAPDDWYFANILEEDRLLTESLAAHSLSALRVDWADPRVDWSRFRLAVLRSTWDYFDRIDEFRAWLGRAERETQVLNEPATLRWNLDKHYLRDLAERGVPSIPALYLEAGDPRPLASVLGEFLPQHGVREAVIKPCVGGAARLTHRVSAENADAVDAELAAARAREAFLVQPFVPEVVSDGELTVVVMDGAVTHAVRKKARAGDFRVQDDYGGTWAPEVPDAEAREAAERAVGACTPTPAYARVDLVRDAEGMYRVMELELIEPELWMRAAPAAASRFAAAIAARL